MFCFPVCDAAFVFVTLRPEETWLVHYKGPLESKSVSLAIFLPAVGIVIDLYVLILPLVATNRVHMLIRRKVIVNLMFLTGVLLVMPLSSTARALELIMVRRVVVVSIVSSVCRLSLLQDTNGYLTYEFKLILTTVSVFLTTSFTDLT